MADEPTLLRIDRDTGEGTPVGPTGMDIFGLAYDPENRWFVGSPMNGGQLVAIDPETAMVAPLATSASTGSMHRLALVPPSEPTVAVDDPARAARPRVVLRAFPNPIGTAADLRFVLDRRARVSVEVFDAMGRSLDQRRLGTYGPGTHTYRWARDGGPGGSLGPGVYFLRLTAGSMRQETKITVAD